MPTIVGKAVRVVEHDGLAIDELAGNVASSDDTLSIARVTVAEPTSEPWLTLDYDEWLCVIKGRIELNTPSGQVVVVNAGETAFVSKGERFRPVFPVGDTEYIPVCLPAFRPDRCIREEEGGDNQVSAKLEQLHSSSEKKQCDEEILYHMCQKDAWEEAIASKKAYFPPTFVKDGMFTHATAVPERLITTANHFYTSVEGEWICLELSRKALLQIGIDTVFEEAKPVGDTGVSNTWDWICPHIYGGISTTIDGIVYKTYPMKRQPDGTFVSIVGLTDQAS
jgi:uncharacterized protein (DUF952 family)/mannose-6-phosphate isomerase-like protein (cupin superfamily)